MSAATPCLAPRPVRVVRARRGTFGLDNARPPDLRRVEGAIRDWLAAHVPGVLALSAVPAPGDRARTLVLLLPPGRVAVLRVADRREVRADPVAEACRAARVPVSAVGSVAEARAALRRLGVEPERS